MANDTDKTELTRFRGLNNVVDPMRLGPDWMVQADNIDITSTAGIRRSTGYSRLTTNTRIWGAYATKDLRRMYVVDAGELRQINPDFTHTVLKAGLASLSVYFEEVNGVVYYTNGTDYGCIEPAGWRNWGIAPPVGPTLSLVSGDLPHGIYQVTCTHADSRGLESSCGEITTITGSGQINITDIPQEAGYTTNVYVTTAGGTVFYLLLRGAGVSTSYNDENNLGSELPYLMSDMPRGTHVTHFQGKLYCADIYPQYDVTAIHCSLPVQYHHFDYASEGIAISGVVRMMVGTMDALVVGTDRAIYAYDGEKLEELADYGVVDGWHATMLGDQLYFWSLRGLCSFKPFRNMTEDSVSAAPGASAGAAVIEQDGMQRYVVALLKDGTPYNRR